MLVAREHDPGNQQQQHRRIDEEPAGELAGLMPGGHGGPVGTLDQGLEHRVREWDPERKEHGDDVDRPRVIGEDRPGIKHAQPR